MQQLIDYRFLLISIGLVVIAVTGAIGQFEVGDKVDELEIQMMKHHWLDSRIDCEHSIQIEYLQIMSDMVTEDLPSWKVDLRKIEAEKTHELCVEIADAWVVLAFRTYGVVIDQEVLEEKGFLNE